MHVYVREYCILTRGATSCHLEDNIVPLADTPLHTQGDDIILGIC